MFKSLGVVFVSLLPPALSLSISSMYSRSMVDKPISTRVAKGTTSGAPVPRIRFDFGREDADELDPVEVDRRRFSPVKLAPDTSENGNRIDFSP